MIDKEKAHDGRIRFGEMLNEAREREGLSCEELGKLVGVSRQTIFKIEKAISALVQTTCSLLPPLSVMSGS